MRSRERSSRENRRFSCLEKVSEDFFHGQLERIHCRAAVDGKLLKPSPIRSAEAAESPSTAAARAGLRAGATGAICRTETPFAEDPIRLKTGAGGDRAAVRRHKMRRDRLAGDTEAMPDGERGDRE